jgi:hypothetical protein
MLQPVGSRTFDAMIAASLAQPHRNVYGDLGPRCPTCSGLGSVLRLGGDGAVTRSASRCGCEGSGLDLPLIERMDREQLWRQVHELQSKLDIPITARYQLPTIKMSRQSWMECVYWMVADATAIAASTTESVIVPNVTIPANYMADGRLLRLKFQGKYSTLGSGVVSHVYKLRWGGTGGTVLATSGTVTLLVSMTNALFTIELMVQTRANDVTGGAGVLFANGEAVAFGGTAPTIGSATGAPATSPMTAGGQTAPAQVSSLTLNADTALSLTITHGANSASNTATGQLYSVESMN